MNVNTRVESIAKRYLHSVALASVETDLAFHELREGRQDV